jgi:hypothetical protein
MKLFKHKNKLIHFGVDDTGQLIIIIVKHIPAK